jgi:cytochrome P450
VQNTRRFMAADAMLCGQQVKAGDAVLVLLAAAAHDPSAAVDDRA